MKTKNIFSIAVAMLFINFAVAQSSAVQNARLSYNDALALVANNDMETMSPEDLTKVKNKIADAIKFIEPAISHEKTSVKEKTWRYRGDIYQLLGRFISKDGFSELSKDPVKLGADSYIKAMELDTKNRYEDENKRGLAIMENIAVNDGINKYNLEDFAGAYQSFDNACMMAEKMGIVDSTAITNAGLSANRAEDYENAIKYYRTALDMNFPDRNLYILTYDALNKMGDKEQALAILREGLQKFPADQDLLITEINVYLNDGKLEEALGNLEKSLENDPENAMLRYTAGSVYDSLDKKPEARAAYEKAIALNPDYFEANYNLGASYYNEAAGIIKDVNQMDLNATKAMKEGTEKATALFTTALPYLEKAYEIEPTDPGTVQSLKEIYVRLNMLDKIKAMK